jgi:hypothetical protein
MTNFTTGTDKNGKTLYYRVNDGKKTKISRAEYEAQTAVETVAELATVECSTPAEPVTEQSGLKSSRWVKVHQQGQGNAVGKDNVLDIFLGRDGLRAEAVYTTVSLRSFTKAAWWLFTYLKYCGAKNLVKLIQESVEAAAKSAQRSEPSISISGDNWRCEIERMNDVSFKTFLAFQGQEVAA